MEEMISVEREPCVDCGLVPSAAGFSRCRKCLLQYKSDREAARRRKYREAGVCLYCRAAPAKDGSISCKECQDAQYQRSRARKRATGECSNCPRPAIPGMSVCEFHREHARMKVTERQFRFKEQGLCWACGKPQMPGSVHCEPCRAKAAARRSKYDIKHGDYDRLAALQGGRCAICRGLQNSRRAAGGRLFIDHDHKTGKIRALLCGLCNTAIGQLRDSPDLARAAAVYLEKHAALPRAA